MINTDSRFLTEWVPKLGSDVALLLIHLTGYIDKNRTCYPSQKRICDELGFNIKKLGKCIKKLTEAGLLKIRQKREKNGQWNRNEYTIQSKYLSNYANNVIPITDIRDQQETVSQKRPSNKSPKQAPSEGTPLPPKTVNRKGITKY